VEGVVSRHHVDESCEDVGAESHGVILPFSVLGFGGYPGIHGTHGDEMLAGETHQARTSLGGQAVVAPAVPTQTTEEFHVCLIRGWWWQGVQWWRLGSWWLAVARRWW